MAKERQPKKETKNKTTQKQKAKKEDKFINNKLRTPHNENKRRDKITPKEHTNLHEKETKQEELKRKKLHKKNLRKRRNKIQTKMIQKKLGFFRKNKI